MDPLRCKQSVFSQWHRQQCRLKPWKDGFCKTHHPDSVRARNEKAKERWNMELENSPYRKIETLTAQRDELLAAAKRVLPLVRSQYSSDDRGPTDMCTLLENAIQKVEGK